jgi:hypothetical protein
MAETYEIRVHGRVGPALRAAFNGMRCEVVPQQTVIRGRLSSHELDRLLRQIDRFGVLLVDLRHTQHQATGQRTCQRQQST